MEDRIILGYFQYVTIPPPVGDADYRQTKPIMFPGGKTYKSDRPKYQCFVLDISGTVGLLCNIKATNENDYILKILQDAS